MPRARGRTRAHERETDDTEGLLGSSIEVSAEHTQAVAETESKELSGGLKKNYRNRLNHIMEFLREKYPEYFAAGVRELAPGGDPNSFHHNNSHDLIYKGLNVKFIKAFLAYKKCKDDGKMMGLVNIRKYRDALQWGSKQAKQPLPASFYNEIETFLKSFKKESAEKKKEGMVEDKSADPISWTLFLLFLNWALEDGDVFVWTYSLLQWNCMARSTNIAPLGLHNIVSSDDFLKFVYDKTKKDQEGEKCRDKHVYANSSNPLACTFLALGVYFALEEGRFERTQLLFKENHTKDESASTRYCASWKGIFEDHEKEVRNHMRYERANVHGIRKGSATKAVSGTTCPPSISSIANRGEWPLGVVL